MSYETKFKNWKELVKEASSSTLSANAAAAKLGIKVDTYKKYALKYGCYNINQAGIGIIKKTRSDKLPLNDILMGKYPQYQSNKLRIRLLEEKVFEHKCQNCNNTEWLGELIPLELEHINGVSSDHRIENLQMLCPNCHALTPTYRGRNKGRVVE